MFDNYSSVRTGLMNSGDNLDSDSPEDNGHNNKSQMNRNPTRASVQPMDHRHQQIWTRDSDAHRRKQSTIYVELYTNTLYSPFDQQQHAERCATSSRISSSQRGCQTMPEAIMRLVAGTTPTEFILPMVNINTMTSDNQINKTLKFLQNIFVYTTFSDNNHNNRFSMFQHQVQSSKTSAPSVQSTTASTSLILTSLSSTWSTESSCRRSLQRANNIEHFSATQAPCHQLQGSIVNC